MPLSLDQQFVAARNAHVQGDLVSAAKGYAAVLTGDPEHADAWHLVGLLTHQRNQSQTALKHFRRAIQLNPGNPEYFSNLAAVLNKLKRHTDALQAAEKALELDPDFGPAQFQKGAACSELELMDAALDSLQQSLSTGFADVPVLRQIAETQQFIGDNKVALQNVEKALKKDQNCPSTYFQLSSFVRTGQYSFTDQQQARIRQLITTTRDDLIAQNRLHICLAIQAEKTRRFSDAFRHYDVANQLKQKHLDRLGIAFSPETTQRTHDDIRAFYTPEKIRQHTLSDESAQHWQPIFVVGMPRSGSTLIQQILSQHSEIDAVGEVTTLPHLVIDEFGDGVTSRLAEQLSSLTDEAISRIAKKYRAGIAQSLHKSSMNYLSSVPLFIVDKMLGNYQQLGLIRMMFPQAKIINCLRDPRDICLSCFCQSFAADQLQAATSSLENLATVYRVYADLMDYWRTTLPGGFFEIVYEELLDSPEEHITQLVNYVGVRWEDQCLEFHQGKSYVRTASMNQVRKPIYKSSRQKWKRFEEQLEPLSILLQEEISAFEASRTQLTRRAAG